MRIINSLKMMGLGSSSLSPITEKQLKKDAAYYRALADVSGRVTGASDYFYDIFEDDETSHSAGVLDTTKTTFKQAVPAGTTDISSLVNSTAGFQKGQEITVFNDVNFERPTVTRAETTIDDVVFDRTTPVTVVGSAYTTSASARPQRLSNGWIVVGAWNSTTDIRFYVSKDGGATFTFLCYGPVAGYSNLGLSITSYGTIVYGIYSNTNNSAVYGFKFDATTVVVGGNATGLGYVDNNQTSGAFSGCSIAVSSTGVLTAAWASKNSTYPNSFNIRCAKSVNGGATWTKQDGTAGVDYVISPISSTGSDYVSPCVIYANDEKPIIFSAYADNSVRRIMYCKFSGTAWSGSYVYNSIGSYAQSVPSATVQKYGTNAGRIWVVWAGMDSVGTSIYNIKYSYSDDNGYTWLTMQKLTSGNSNHQTYPTVTSNKNGNIYVLWQGMTTISLSYYNIRQIMWDGSTWSSITEITSQNIAHMYNPSTCDNYHDFEQPLVTWKDNQSSSIKFRGKWTGQASVSHLEITPLQNNYKQNAVVCRSSVITGEFTDTYTNTTSTPVDRSTPTTVVGNAYDTSGNGGRKLVRLSNGWLVAGTIGTDGYIYLSLSRDNGANWDTPLKTMGATFTSCAIVSKNMTIYIIGAQTSNYSVFHRSYLINNDGTFTQQNNLYVEPASVQTAIGYCSLAIGSNGVLHAAWASINSTYPNAYNIRYSKSTNGGVTWDTVTQVTTTNTSGIDMQHPCIIVNSNNQPVIVFTNTNPSYMTIEGRYYNGTSWVTGNVTSAANIYPQASPCTVVSPDGIIHIVWHGKDSTDTTVHNIRYSKSMDGGATWSTALKLTTGNSYNQVYPSITSDKNNNLYVLWHGPDAFVNPPNSQIRRIIYNNSLWSDVVTLTSNSAQLAGYPSTCVNYIDFTDPLCIYKDNEAGAVKFRGVWTDVITTTTTKTLHKMKFSSNFVDSRVYDRSVPIDITTTSTSNSTSGNGGRKLVRLNNGWLVCGFEDGSDKTIRIQVSYDGGINWVEIGTRVYSATSSGLALATDGTKVYFLHCINGIAVYCKVISDFITTGQNFGVAVAVIDNNQSSLGDCSITIDSVGVLHAAWASRNSSYPDSYNVRYSKSTDGGVTWNTVIQVTTNNATNEYTQNPTIIVRSDNYPIIISERAMNSTGMIICSYWTGSTFGGSTIYSNTYVQRNPCAVVSTDGIIHAVWYGSDGGDGTYNIRYSKSVDGGTTWTTKVNVSNDTSTNQQYDPSITLDKNNNIYVLWHGYNGGANQIRKRVYITSWSDIINLTDSTTAHSTYVSTCFNYTDFTDPLCIYSVNAAVKFRGVWTDLVNVPVLVEDARYNITPKTGSSGETASWIQYDHNTELSVDSKTSIVGSTDDEDYLTMNKTVTAIDENTDEAQFELNTTPNSKITQRITLTRDSVDVDKGILQYIGAL